MLIDFLLIHLSLKCLIILIIHRYQALIIKLNNQNFQKIINLKKKK